MKDKIEKIDFSPVSLDGCVKQMLLTAAKTLNADVVMPFVRRPMHNRSGYSCIVVVWYSMVWVWVSFTTPWSGIRRSPPLKSIGSSCSRLHPRSASSKASQGTASGWQHRVMCVVA
jgi:hypothetical protein